MSNQSIFEKKWLEIVFENRNKAYGAYKLRQESPKTSLFAFLIGIAFLSSSVFVLSSFSNRNFIIPIDKPDSGVIHVVALFHPVNPTNIILPLVEKKKTEIKEDVKSKDLKDPIIIKADEKTDDVKTNEETKKHPDNTNSLETGTSTTVTLSGETSIGTNIKIGNDGNENDLNGTVGTAMVDVKPDFPGGLTKFYEYVANNFDASTVDTGTIISIYVSFVVEKDGSLTDVKVLRNPGFGLDKEAIRVLKSIKTKWKPGLVKGKPVRTSYTLPIKVKAE